MMETLREIFATSDVSALKDALQSSEVKQFVEEKGLLLLQFSITQGQVSMAKLLLSFQMVRSVVQKAYRESIQYLKSYGHENILKELSRFGIQIKKDSCKIPLTNQLDLIFGVKPAPVKRHSSLEMFDTSELSTSFDI